MDAGGPGNLGEPPTSSSVRQSRIQFPAEGKGSTHFSAVENASRQSGIGIGHPPILRGPTTAQTSSNSDRRRRVRSVDATVLLSEPTQAARTTESPSRNIRRRTLTQVASGLANKATSAVRAEDASTDFGTLSDEYTLGQSLPYPGILEDVQRALKLKARREARLRVLQANSVRGDAPARSDLNTISSVSAGSSVSPMEVSFPTSTAPSSHILGPSNESDIDFSPSVGVTHLHPVPTSSDNGTTLDWTRSTPTTDKHDIRRWTMSLTSKGKSKERNPSLGKGVAEQQDLLYIEKLKRIRDKTRSGTVRKAAITSEQLQRRYNVIYASLTSKAGPLNLAKVVGWYSSQEPIVKSTLDQAEPLTWLKHLLDKRGERASSRLPWHVTALIVEEYLKSQTYPDSELMMNGPSTAGSPSLDSTRSTRDARSLNISQHSSIPIPLEPSFSRKRSFDEYVSFEPKVEPGREYASMDVQRRPEPYTRSWRHSLPNAGDSARSSFSSILTSSLRHPHAQGELSPASSRGYLREYVRRRSRQQHLGSDGESSVRASLSDVHPHSEGEGVGTSRQQANNISVHSMGDTDTDREARSASRASSEEQVPDSEDPQTARFAYRSDGEAQFQPRFIPKRSVTEHSFLPRVVVPPRRNRASLFPYEQLSRDDDESDYLGVDEDAERREYERKAQMLEDAVAQNNRIRMLLQRVATAVKEYETVRRQLSELSRTPSDGLPQDLIDAFSHDPAAVTGSTRRSKGWRAVDDIHSRLQLQHDVMRSFVAREGRRHSLDARKSVFEDQVNTLVETLHRLEDHRQTIERRAVGIADMLADVKPIHLEAKREYNETLAHTSVVYDELSLIVRLEESYKDNYQQLWEFGMDALTFLLDTVTPFWRNYGKVIGEDVQDFLIIPWYRNEFTGEAKRYPIKRLPHRSLRHWLGLFLFFNLTVAVTFLQARAAIFISSLWRLSAISHAGLWWLVLPIFWTGFFIQWIAVLIELAIVGGQMAVVVWWFGWALKVLS
ncbi:hypothetical protein NEOLEDRAFT_1053133 [Neolentinus lepideus HHB14362 ss-1]|uniref:Uncharacterized protein n=1 Tax=Neolentinus lepideus HHB14362 ss-1 TaxID=1314782 RepID=A0A165W9A1_9AGAM|nr:hypothetical protein NEOLEDRAFT_1053133 [Neolentinus lepideus HHB14362 ss-1]